MGLFSKGGGFEVKDLIGLSPEDQFMKIGLAIADLEDPTLRAAAAQDIFGRAGTMLLPLFAEGSEGMKNLAEDAHKLGIIFDTEAAAKAAKLKDAQTALKKAVQGVAFAIVEDLVPHLTKLAEHSTDVFVNIRGNAQTFTRGILDFFGIIAQGIMGLMMAWHSLQAGVFKVASYVAKTLEKHLYAVVTQLVILEKIPIIGKKIVPITDAMWESLKTLTIISEGYDDEAEKQINILSNQVSAFENLKKILSDIKDGFNDLAIESTMASETIVNTMLPATTSVWEELMKLGQVQEEVAEWTGKTSKEMSKKQLDAFTTLAMGIQGGAAGVVGAIKQIMIAEMLKSLAMSGMPFLAKLAMMFVTVGLIEAVFSKFMKATTKGYAEGGRIGKPISMSTATATVSSSLSSSLYCSRFSMPTLRSSI